MPAISLVIQEVIANPLFTRRVRAVAAVKALFILGEPTPDTKELAWAKLVVASGFDVWTEALLILTEVQPTTSESAYSADDATYAARLDTILAKAILARGL